jgi:hypothetical protein
MAGDLDTLPRRELSVDVAAQMIKLIFQAFDLA